MKHIQCYFFLFAFAISITSCRKKHGSNEITPVKPLKITGFSPAQNINGAEFTIKGSGFDPVASNNVVKIGNFNTIILAATDSTLTVNTSPDAYTGKITVTRGASSVTSEQDYTLSPPPYSTLNFISVWDINRNIYDYEYDNNNKITVRNESEQNPVEPMFPFYKGSAKYTYNAAGLLEKEVFTPSTYPEGPGDITAQKMIEYFYTNGKLSSDKLSSLNTTDPANPVSTVLLMHTYTFTGNQLSKTITQNGAGVQTSIENYTYSIENNVPKVVRQINSVTDGLSTETYFQTAGVVDPYAYLIPGAPKPNLFFVDSAKFSNPALRNYRLYVSPGMAMRYEYKGGFADGAYYYLGPKK